LAIVKEFWSVCGVVTVYSRAEWYLYDSHWLMAWFWSHPTSACIPRKKTVNSMLRTLQ